MAESNNQKDISIGIFIYNLSQGGAERFVSYLLSFLIKNNIQVHLILMNDNPIVYNIPKETKIIYLEKSKDYEKGIIKLLKIPILAYKYKELCKKTNITHSFSLLSRPNMINVLSKSLFKNKTKVVLSERAYPSLQYGYGGMQSTVMKKMISLTYSKADSIISNSKGNGEDLIKNFRVPKKKISVINNPIDLEKIWQTPLKKKFFDLGYFNLISIGRLSSGKNHMLLIKAVENLKKVRLYIIGDGLEKNILKAYIKDKNLANQVFLLGFNAAPFPYLKAADLFVFGSNHEGFPNVLLEAMACGLPIISTNCKSGPSEILKLEKSKQDDIMITDYGILVPLNNIDLMNKAILFYIDNPIYYKKCKITIKKRVLDFKSSKISNLYLKKIIE